MSLRLVQLRLPALIAAVAVLGWLALTARIEPLRPGSPAPPVPLRGATEPVTPIEPVTGLDSRKVALGWRLFHERQLSVDGSVACVDCHSLARGGADGLPFSVGAGKQQTRLNTPSVFNSATQFRQFWDGRAADLPQMLDDHLKHPTIMASSWPDALQRLGRSGTYADDFASVYARSGLHEDTVRDALGQLLRALATPNARFDRYLRGDKSAITAKEYAGYQLFQHLGCSNCHQGVNIGGNLYERISLTDNYVLERGKVTPEDYGRYNLTGVEAHRYQFKVASLRNVALTAPYFHDGSVQTLEQAVTIMGFYQQGINLSHDEVSKIVAFLNTLTGDLPDLKNP